jgi:hypothetical protein
MTQKQINRKEKLCKIFVNWNRNWYSVLGYPFGAKQEEIFEWNFNDSYSHERNSYERRKLGWFFLDNLNILKGENYGN